jgi:hypothetical protein
VSENVQKLVGVVVMAVLVVVGVVVSSGDDTDFSRNRSFRDNPATFAGADRVKEADCCDQNAYEISLLQAKYEDLQNEIALLKGNYDALVGSSYKWQHLFEDDNEAAEKVAKKIFNSACSASSFGPAVAATDSGQKMHRAACIADQLIGFDVEFARQVVLHMVDDMGGGADFGFIHRATRTDLSSEETLSPEACLPINYGFVSQIHLAIAVDTVDGVVAHPVHFSFWFSEWSERRIYWQGEWEQKIEEQGLCA